MTKATSYMCVVVKNPIEIENPKEMLARLSQAPGIQLLSLEKAKEGIELALRVDEAEVGLDVKEDSLYLDNVQMLLEYNSSAACQCWRYRTEYLCGKRSAEVK